MVVHSFVRFSEHCNSMIAPSPFGMTLVGLALADFTSNVSIVATDV